MENKGDFSNMVGTEYRTTVRQQESPSEDILQGEENVKIS